MPVTPTFVNPATSTTYRMVVTGASWRMTKSAFAKGRVRLAHLRGDAGDGPVDDAAVARLVAGQGGVAAGAADPRAVFAAVVVMDLERTADVLTAVAHEARLACERGRPGFRPGCAPLRQQRDEAMATAVRHMQAMAAAWTASGLIAGRTLPDWLVAAIADAASG